MSVMQAKHYEFIARIIRSMSVPRRLEMADYFAVHFKNDNPKFDWGRFLKAAYGDMEGASK